MRTLILISNSAVQTKKIGRALGLQLGSGTVVALKGPLGAGKTTLVKGIAKGLGFKNEKAVSSPTFTVMHEYQGRESIHHLDWYRLSSVSAADAESAEECFASGVTLIEWPERGKTLIPKDCWRVRIIHRGPSSRRLELSLPEDAAAALLKEFKAR